MASTRHRLGATFDGGGECRTLPHPAAEAPQPGGTSSRCRSSGVHHSLPPAKAGLTLKDLHRDGLQPVARADKQLWFPAVRVSLTNPSAARLRYDHHMVLLASHSTARAVCAGRGGEETHRRLLASSVLLLAELSALPGLASRSRGRCAGRGVA